MVATSAPFGFRPIFHESSHGRIRCMNGAIPSGYNTDIFEFQPVKWATTGVLQPVNSTSDAFIGTFLGVRYNPPGGLRPVFSTTWPANATYLTGSCYVYFTEDPALEYYIQADGAVAQSAIGDESTFTNLTANNGLGGSQATMSASLAGAGNQGQLRIRNLSLMVNNAWGDAYTVTTVSIAKHQFVYPQTAI